MKKLLFSMACAFTCFIANAQETRNVQREFTEQAAFPFQQLERQRVPHGILENYALALTEITLYDGVVRDTNSIDIQVFSDLFRELHSARIHPSSEEDFVSMEVYAKRWNNYRKEFNSVENDETTIVLGGLLYNYSMITSDALSERKITFEGNQFHDVYRNGVWQNPYIENVAVAISAPVTTVPTGDFNVVFPQDMFLGNDVDNIESIKIDFGNGAGFKNIIFNNPIQVAAYSTPGKYIWKAEITMNNGRRYWIDILIEALERAQKHNVRIANGNYGATLRIDYLNDNDKRITRPLIVAEGFDPGSVINPEVKGGSTTLDDFQRDLRAPLKNQLIDNQQYDIIYVDWDNGIGDIKQNAETLKKIIKYVNNQKAINGSTEPNILLGQSMGGLVGKYALVKLENEGYTHQVKLFATHDSPMRGSNTPIGIQFMGRHVLEMYVGNPFASAIGEVVLPLVQDLTIMFGWDFMEDFSTPGDNLTLMDAPAAVQMNNYYVSPSYQVKDEYHNIWQTEFDVLGYPNQDNIRNIAISNGSMCATTQGYLPGSHFLKFTKETDQDEFKSVLRDMGMTFWGATSHMPNLVIASVIPGTSRLRIDFQIKAIPETTASDREVYRGILKYDKLIYVPKPLQPWKKMLVGTITVNMYDKRGYAPNTCLPIDNVSGGNESIRNNIPDMVDDLTNVSNYVINSNFSFVPTASALDIRRNNGNPNLADYNRPYSTTNLTSLDPSLSSPFDNFMAESRGLNKHAQLVSNFGHINFTLKNASFLTTEMNALTNNAITVPNTDCGAFCNLTGITGPSTICKNAIYEYSIPNIGNHDITWDVPQGMLITEEITNTRIRIRVTIAQNSSIGGTHEIKIIVRTESCGEFRFTKTVNIGMQGPDGIYGSNQFYYSNNPNLNLPQGERTYSVDPVPGALYYEWDVTGGFVDVTNFSSQPTQWEIIASTKNTNEIDVKASGPATLKVRTCNDCGCSNYTYLQIKSVNIDDYFQQYPNPADDHITLSLKEGVEPPAFEGNRTDVRIYDMQGRMKKQFVISSTGGETNVSELPIGIYKMLIDLQNGSSQVITLKISR